MLRSGSTAFGTRLVEESRSKAARKPSVQSSSVNCELADELDCKSKRSASSESLISESSAVLKGLRRRGGRHGFALLSQNSVGPSGFVAMLIAMADACFVFRPFVVGSARKMKCRVEVLFHSVPSFTWFHTLENDIRPFPFHKSTVAHRQNLISNLDSNCCL